MSVLNIKDSEQIALTFEKLNFLNCLGVIDGKCVRMKCSVGFFYSIVHFFLVSTKDFLVLLAREDLL